MCRQVKQKIQEELMYLLKVKLKQPSEIGLDKLALGLYFVVNSSILLILVFLIRQQCWF